MSKPPTYGAQPPGYSTAADYGSPQHIPPPPPAPQQLAYATGASTVIIQQPVKLHSRHPAVVTCQHCRQTVTTQPRTQVGTVTWLACGLMILFGFWLGCCLIPFCIPDLQDTYHECPNCKNLIDVYKPL